MSRSLVGTVLHVPLGDIHVRLDGPEDAPVLVLLHGFASSLHWWDRVVPLLAERHRVVRMDLLGHGASSRPRGGYDPEGQARLVEQVLEALHVGEATVVGHSMGAAIAVALAEQSPRVASLVLVNEAPGYELNTFPRLQHVVLQPVIGKLLLWQPPAFALRRGLAVAYAPGFDQRAAFDDEAVPLADARLTPACFRGALVGKRRFSDVRPLDRRLRDLGRPTLVVWGARDQLWSTAGALARYRAVPDVEVVVIEEAGHSPQIEAPGPVADAIIRFTDAHHREESP